VPALTGQRLTSALAVLVLAVGGAVLIVVVLSSRDRSTFNPSAGPGQLLPDDGDQHLVPGTPDPPYSSRPPVSGAHVRVSLTRDGVTLSDDQLLTALEQGDVVLAYADRRLTRPLRALANGLAGPFDPVIAQAGQAVILDLQRHPPPAPIVALAWRHRLQVTSADDPRLVDFADHWLGRGAPAAAH
jgi:hypothetical protein